MTFCERVKLILKFKKISQVDFAKSADLHQSRVSLLLSGKRRPTSKEMIKIIKVLNVPYDCLIGNVPLFDELLIDCTNNYYLW